MTNEQTDYKVAYIICLERLAEADKRITELAKHTEESMKMLAESRSRLMDTLIDLRKVYQIKYGEDIKEQLDA